MDAILSRRSIRRYRPQPVPDNVITELLEAAMSAPSAGNEQPWHFIVIDERRLLDAIPRFHPYSRMLAEAPAAILVCAGLRGLKYQNFWVQDCAAATENILIAARDRGLGACWLGVYPVEPLVDGMRSLLSIPEGFVPVSLIALGYPAEEKPPAGRYSPARVHRNGW